MDQADPVWLMPCQVGGNSADDNKNVPVAIRSENIFR